jgi:hypothetical protein
VVQKQALASASDSLKVEASNALQSFERSMEGLAQTSADRWRLKLASSLSTVAKRLGEQLQSGDETQR